MKFYITLIITTLSISLTAQTRSINSSPPLKEGDAASVGISEERLERIDAMCLDIIERNQVPGMVALVARNGIIVYHKAFGIADTRENRHFKPNDIFRIASQTKAITSTAVMMLWEEGLFQLDDPISWYIPEFKDPAVLESFNEADSSYTTVPANSQITIRQLLTHTSGLGYGFIDGDSRFTKIYQKAGIIDAFTTKPITLEENIKKLAKLPLHFNPGEKYRYCEGLDVLGYFVEIMSGMPFDKFLRERIFDPLGMDDTWFYLPESMHKRLVPVQTKKNEQWVTYPVTPVYDPDYPISGAKTYFAGGAGLSSTAKDYATFLQMYLNQGELNGYRLLSRTTIQFMMANQIGDLWGDRGEYYGLAFGVLDQKGQDKGGLGSKGTFQWGGYFNTSYFADPVENLIGILMKQTQESGNDESGWKFRQLVGQSIDD